MMLADAMRRAGASNGAKVREALASTRNFVGVTGITTLDAKRNVAKAASVVVVRRGQPEFVLSISP
jgi:branched-chain amino acid transport system substrate-binding protein